MFSIKWFSKKPTYELQLRTQTIKTGETWKRAAPPRSPCFKQCFAQSLLTLKNIQSNTWQTSKHSGGMTNQSRACFVFFSFSLLFECKINRGRSVKLENKWVKNNVSIKAVASFLPFCYSTEAQCLSYNSNVRKKITQLVRLQRSASIIIFVLVCRVIQPFLAPLNQKWQKGVLIRILKERLTFVLVKFAPDPAIIVLWWGAAWRASNQSKSSMAPNSDVSILAAELRRCVNWRCKLTEQSTKYEKAENAMCCFRIQKQNWLCLNKWQLLFWFPVGDGRWESTFRLRR